MAPGPDGVTVPGPVATVAGTRPLHLAWENERGGLTFEMGTDEDRCFVKWAPRHSGIDLDAETARLAWARPHIAVPRVLDHGGDESGGWIVTSPIPGTSAVAPRWTSDPVTAVTGVGQGLRSLHDALPVDACPFSWSSRARRRDAHQRASAGCVQPTHWHEEHRSLTLARALELLDHAPPVDKLVVCHGDACAPNTMLDDDGRCTGHVDVGALGVADRWADLAVATWSTHWNYGPGFEAVLLAAYGVEPDPVRTRYYRLLWDLGP